METITEINALLNTLQDNLNNATTEELTTLNNNLKTTHENIKNMLEESTNKLDEIKYTTESDGLKPLSELYLKIKSMNRKSNGCLGFLPYDQAKEFDMRSGLCKESWNKHYRKAYNKKNVIDLIYHEWCQFDVLIFTPFNKVQAITIYILCWALGDKLEGDSTTFAYYHKYIKNKFNFEYTDRVKECICNSILQFD